MNEIDTCQMPSSTNRSIYLYRQYIRKYSYDDAESYDKSRNKHRTHKNGIRFYNVSFKLNSITNRINKSYLK